MDNLLIELKIKEISISMFGINSKLQRTNTIMEQLRLELKSLSKKEFSNYYMDLLFVIGVLDSYQKTRCTLSLTDPKHLINASLVLKGNEKERQIQIINLLNRIICNPKFASGSNTQGKR